MEYGPRRTCIFPVEAIPFLNSVHAAFRSAQHHRMLAMYVLLDDFAEREVAGFITGDKDIQDDAVWADYLASIEAMDVRTMIEIRQQAYDRWAQN